MAGCIASAAGAVVLLITGQHPDVGRMQPDELALAASAATALLAMKLPRTVRGPVVAGGVTFAAVFAGMRIPKEMGPVPPYWLVYFAVDDSDRTVDKAKGMGAKVGVPPTDIPNIGRFAILNDPQGAGFAVIKLQMPAQA